MRVLVTGGGTGGHIYPALAIMKGIRAGYPEAEILFVGNAKGLEAEIVPREGFAFRSVTVQGLPRKMTRVFRVAKALFMTCKGCCESYKLLKEFKPTVVIGTGGYVCFSIVMIAAFLRIPTLIQEQNALPGRANRVLARVASKVAVAFPESQEYFTPKADIVVTGLPVRTEILSKDRDSGLKAFDLDKHKFTILGTGGSQGARSLNKAMVEVIAEVGNDQGIQIIHVTGPAGYENTVKELKARGIDPDNCKNIVLKPYLYNMDEALAAANLVVCRAGATTIAEITVRGLPSILIPYPYAANNHQEYNAMALVKNGAALMLNDRDISGPRLWKELRGLLLDNARLTQMAQKAKQLGKPHAVQHLVQMVGELNRNKY